MKKNLILAFLLSSVYFAFAQKKTILNNPAITPSYRRNPFDLGNTFDIRDVPMRGTRYFNDSLYHKGELQTTTALYTTELAYRYDQIERTAQVRMPEGQELWLLEKDIVYFKLFIDDKVLLFEPASVPNGQKITLLQVIYKSPTMQLLRDPRKYVFRVRPEAADGYSSDIVYDEVRKKYRYFVNKGGNTPFKEIKPTAKSLIKLMPEKKARITQLFKTAQKKGGLTVSKLEEILAQLDEKKEAVE